MTTVCAQAVSRDKPNSQRNARHRRHQSEIKRWPPTTASDASACVGVMAMKSSGRARQRGRAGRLNNWLDDLDPSEDAVFSITETTTTVLRILGELCDDDEGSSAFCLDGRSFTESVLPETSASRGGAAPHGACRTRRSWPRKSVVTSHSPTSTPHSFNYTRRVACSDEIPPYTLCMPGVSLSPRIAHMGGVGFE